MKLKLLTLFLILLTLTGFSQNVPNPERWVLPYGLSDNSTIGSYGYKFSTNYWYAYRSDVISTNGNFFENEYIPITTTNGLKSWLPFPAPYVGTQYCFAVDCTNDFRVINAVWTNVYSGVMSFNGINAVLISATNFPKITNAITICVWMKTTADDSTARPFINRYETGNQTFALYMAAGYKIFGLVGADGGAVNLNGQRTTTAINLTNWTYICWSFDCVTQAHAIYIDGIKQSTELAGAGLDKNIPSIWHGGTSSVRMANWGLADIPLNALMDNQMIFNRAITSNEQYQIYNDTKSKYVTPFISPASIPGLKTWLKWDTLGYPDGSAVLYWPDSSGFGYSFTQATPSVNFPYYTNSVIGTNGGVYFKGPAGNGSEFSLYQTNFPGVSQPDTVIMVFKVLDYVGADAGILDSTESTKRQIIGKATSFGNGVGQYAGSWANSNAVAINQAVYYTAIFNGASSKTSTNGITFTSIGNPGANTLGKILLGKFYDWAGPKVIISELLVYDSEITGMDRTNLNTYIRNKYGL